MTLANDDTSRPYAALTSIGARRGLKGISTRDQSTTRASPVKWPIYDRYGLGRDQSQFIVYRACTPKPGKPQRRMGTSQSPFSLRSRRL